jgi:glycosyltransferase involved in cell wall biosynthesis
MSYQREPSLKQVQKANKLSKKGSLVFTGCSNYISDQIKTIAEAYTIYNCAPIEKYVYTSAIPEDAPLVFLGRIEDIKGTHIAIEVAQKSNKRLIIAGNIPDDKKEYFDERVKPHLNDRIVYIGSVNDVQKNDILGSALAFLMPLQWNEPFGIVMAEAMACGTPILAFPFGSVPEVVTHGVNGFICKNTDDMIEKVGFIDSLNRKTVREIATEKFSDKKIASDYLALYRKLIERKI